MGSKNVGITPRGADYERMKKAVDDWTKKCGDYYDDDGEPKVSEDVLPCVGAATKDFS